MNPAGAISVSDATFAGAACATAAATRAAERMPHQVRAADPERVEEARDALGERPERPVPDVLAGGAVPRQVERVARRPSSTSGCCTNSQEFLSPP